MVDAVEASPDHPILIDKFLEDAIEIDVDAVCDGERTIVAGVMEHIEEAGIHSGDSACAIPPFSLPRRLSRNIKKQTYALAEALEVRGLMNIQFAVKEGEVLYPRGQSASLANRAVRLQSHGDEHRASSGQGDGGDIARTTRRSRPSRSQPMFRSRRPYSRSRSFPGSISSWARKCGRLAR